MPSCSAPSSRARGAVGRLLVLLVVLALPGAPLLVSPAASATSYGGAVAGAWPTSWAPYTYADGRPVGDTNDDQTPPYLDIASGACTSCIGPQPSVLFANDGTSAFFRMRMAVDNNDATKGGLFAGAYLVQIADASGTVKAVVGVNGKLSVADNVYVTTGVGDTTQIVYEYPFTGSSAAMRWIPVGDGTGQYYLDFQVPVSVIDTISGGAITPTTPIKLYYGSSAAANLATINKDLMIPGATGVDFSTLAVKALVPATYSVTFQSDGGSSVPSQSVTQGDPVVPPTAPTRAGYTFAGWYLGSSAYNFDTPVSGPLTLTAHWTRITYAVTFDSAGGSLVDPQSVVPGESATAPDAPTWTGHSFAGWYAGGSLYDFSASVTAPVPLVAHWTVDSYEVTFDSQGGSPVSPQTVDFGTRVTEPAVPTLPGYTFVGWYAGPDAYDFATPVPGALTLTARWARVAYPITFDSAGGTTVEPQTVEEDGTITRPTDPTRTGFSFAGWYLGEEVYDFSVPVSGVVALTAHWTRNSYVVSFDSNGGRAVGPVSVQYGDPVAAPAPPTRRGYAFTGWYVGALAYQFATPVTSGLNLVAHWEQLAPPDRDNDGLPDAIEMQLGTDPANPDSDDDGLPDGVEVSGARNTYGRCATNPLRSDSDRDGLTDFAEIDGVRLRGVLEVARDRVIDLEPVTPDPCRADTDGDRLEDGAEVRGRFVRWAERTYRSNPVVRDTDRDGLGDRVEITGSANRRFHRHATDPMNWDTDGGGVSDLDEVRAGSDPNDVRSWPANPRPAR